MNPLSFLRNDPADSGDRLDTLNLSQAEVVEFDEYGDPVIIEIQCVPEAVDHWDRRHWN